MIGNEALAEAIAGRADLVNRAELTKTESLVNIVEASAIFSIGLASWWNELTATYQKDMYDSTKDPSAIPLASAAYAQYQQAVQEGQTEMNQQDTLLQTNKGALSSLGKAMTNVYSLMNGPIQFAKDLSRIIKSFGHAGG